MQGYEKCFWISWADVIWRENPRTGYQMAAKCGEAVWLEGLVASSITAAAPFSQVTNKKQNILVTTDETQ